MFQKGQRMSICQFFQKHPKTHHFGGALDSFGFSHSLGLWLRLRLRRRRSLGLGCNIGHRLIFFTWGNVGLHGNLFQSLVLLGWRTRFRFLICLISKRNLFVVHAWQSLYLISVCLLFALLVIRLFLMVWGSGPHGACRTVLALSPSWWGCLWEWCKWHLIVVVFITEWSTRWPSWWAIACTSSGSHPSLWPTPSRC